MEQNRNKSINKGERVNLTFNSKQIDLIDSLTIIFKKTYHL